MKQGQRGTARNGQHGTITEVHPNTVRFLSDTGAHFTLLNVEFTPDSASGTERRAIRTAAKKFFSAIRSDEGFHFGYKRRKGRIVEAFLKRIPGYLGIPDAEPYPEPEEV